MASAMPPAAQPLTVVHSMPLLREPMLDAPVIAFIWRSTTVIADRLTNGFWHVTHPDGRQGFLAAAACVPQAVGSEEAPMQTQVVQAIILYREPKPGGQYPPQPGMPRATQMVLPSDNLTLLGRDKQFVLIQELNGRLGYVPLLLCADASTIAAQQRRLFDLSFVLGGIGWFGLQVPVLSTLSSQLHIVADPYQIFVRLAFVAGVVLLLWFGSSQRLFGRSFAIGITIAYALLEVLSGY
jgi:hypothetical protein